MRPTLSCARGVCYAAHEMFDRSTKERASAAFVSALIAGVVFARCNNNTARSQGDELSSGGRSDAGPVRWPSPQEAGAVEDAASSVGDGGAECARDEDCVPASCCHPTQCVAISARPTCEGIMCTSECRGATLDCGGSCGCVAGRCAAHIANMQPPIELDSGVSPPDASSSDASRDAGRRPRRR
ncbi:MAG: hypothetical protein JNK05_06695 [Myxococcales bacterium]|nr:hypothetical protein [Myxococcales bacterium]